MQDTSERASALSNFLGFVFDAYLTQVSLYNKPLPRSMQKVIGQFIIENNLYIFNIVFLFFRKVKELSEDGKVQVTASWNIEYYDTPYKISFCEYSLRYFFFQVYTGTNQLQAF